MDEEALHKRILHLGEVEKLSRRQIAAELGIDRKKVSRIMSRSESTTKPLPPPGMLEPYRQMIVEWYKQRPSLKASQIYERLQSYGFKGSYPTVVDFTKEFCFFLTDPAFKRAGSGGKIKGCVTSIFLLKWERSRKEIRFNVQKD